MPYRGGSRLFSGIPICVLLLFLNLTNAVFQECKRGTFGAEYMGTTSVTVSGLPCQRWDTQSPHEHNYDSAEYFPDATLIEAANLCRNPDGPAIGGPWCYTENPDKRWEYCHVPQCSDQPECKRTERGREYRGNNNYTRTGRECATWRGGEGNYCRNPDNKPEGPWCWVGQSQQEWEYCHVPHCKPSSRCLTSPSGTDYAGFISLTRTGRPCQRWDRQEPHSHVYTNPHYFPGHSLDGAADYCRNPNGTWSAPWCYTLDPDIKWEECDIRPCDCKYSTEGADYAGAISVTISGKACQSWDTQSPHHHNMVDPDRFPDVDVERASNFCRNPDRTPNGPWCYTNDSLVRWEHCDIPLCDQPQAPRQRVNHVLQIGIDGMHPCFVNAAPTNIMERLGRQGTYTLNRARTGMETVSAPSWTSIVTGMTMEATGVTGNSWRAPWRGYDWPITPATGNKIPLPTVFDTLKRQDRNVRTAAFTDWFWWRYMTGTGLPGSLDWDYYCEGYDGHGLECDKYLTGNATKYLHNVLQSAGKSYTFIYLENLDSTGHEHGWCTDAYYTTMKTLDGLVGKILDVIDNINKTDDVMVLLSTDHGGHNYTHGSHQDSDLQIPMFIRGPGIKQGHQFEVGVRNCDMVPTGVNALGYRPNPWWNCDVMSEAFMQP